VPELNLAPSFVTAKLYRWLMGIWHPRASTDCSGPEGAAVAVAPSNPQYRVKTTRAVADWRPEDMTPNYSRNVELFSTFLLGRPRLRAAVNISNKSRFGK
jgi:hypothetical protein